MYDEKLSIIKKYLGRIGTYDGNLTVDHLSGWENHKKPAPDHLCFQRLMDYADGQFARKLRINDVTTHIIAYSDNSDYVSLVYKGRLTNNKVIKLCEKHKCVSSIIVIITDWATGIDRRKSIGY